MTNETAYELEQFWELASFSFNQQRTNIILAATAYLQDARDNSLLQIRQELYSIVYHNFPMGTLFSRETEDEAELKKLVSALVDLGIAQVCMAFPELPYANRFWMSYKEQWGAFPEFPAKLKEDVVALARKVNKEESTTPSTTTA